MGRRRGRRHSDNPSSERTSSQVALLRRELNAALNNVEVLHGELLDAGVAESVADLRQALYEPGWQRFAAATEQEFDPAALVQLRAICRLMAVKNPLIKRGLNLRSAYVWGQGVEITARANGKNPGEQDVQSVVKAFLTDGGNARELTGPAAQTRLERTLGHDGEIYIALFTRPTTGEVQVRTIPADEIAEIISNPEDRSDPWFYRRRWEQQTINPGTGRTETRTVERLYPALGYRPRSRPSAFGSIEVQWDAPVLHVPVNNPTGWQRGIPDVYAALDWARAYKIFLEDWATLVKALSRFAYRLTVKGRHRQQAQARLAAAPARDPSGVSFQDVGATALLPLDGVLEAVPKTGATIDSESGRPLAAMVAAGLDLPVTMLLGDPGTTGNRATAETLDWPTEVTLKDRQRLWASVLQRVLRYVIAESVRAPQGVLRGVITQDRYGRETVALAGDTPTDVDIIFPDLKKVDVTAAVKAVVNAQSTGTMPPDVVLRLLLTALGVRDVDGLVDRMLNDETGEFQWPTGPPLDGGQSAVDRARAGGDPADTGPGRMAPDDDDQDDGDSEG